MNAERGATLALLPAASWAVFGKFVHQGQICMAINRFIVHQDEYDEFVAKFVEKMKTLPCGDPADPKTVVGPIINERQCKRRCRSTG